MLGAIMKKRKSDKPIISIICAIDKNRGIGKNNQLLYKIPKDLAHFKKITSGHPVIMGLKTYQSIGRSLPKRLNIILTRDKNLKISGAIICHSLAEAVKFASKNDNNEIFIIGGANVFMQAINFVDKLYLTVIDAQEPADTFFPDYSNFKKIISSREENSSGYNYKYLELAK